jgi:hypothetical protein
LPTLNHSNTNARTMANKYVYSKNHKRGEYVNTIKKHGKRYVVAMMTDQTEYDEKLRQYHHPVVKIPIEDVIKIEYEREGVAKWLYGLLTRIDKFMKRIKKRIDKVGPAYKNPEYQADIELKEIRAHKHKWKYQETGNGEHGIIYFYKCKCNKQAYRYAEGDKTMYEI